jgi:two-component SAPR family response regulator
LWQLRSIHPGLVRADRTTLALSDGVDIDARRLLRASLGVAGRNGLDVAEPFDVDLFRFDLLPGWYDEWLGQEQERVRQVRLTTLELLTMQLLDAGEYLPAVHTATLAVEGDPLRESAQRALIEVYIRAGNYVDAVRQYERYAAELRSDFGLCPSPMLETLIARLPVNVARFRR